ncbi:MAG: hypothetical protein AAFX06_14165 [Planctomycetota bacterium]
MFQRESTKKAFLSVVAKLADEARNGRAITFEDLNAHFQTLAAHEFQFLLRGIIGTGEPFSGILASYLIHRAPFKDPVKRFATESVIALLGDNDDDDVHGFFFRLFSTLENPPHDFRPITLDTLKSGPLGTRIAAAGLASKLDEDKGDLLPLCVPMLNKLVRDRESPWRHLALTELVAHPVNQSGAESLLIEFLGEASEGQIAALVAKLHTSYRRSSIVTSFMKDLAKSTAVAVGLRCAIYSNIGRVAFDNQSIHKFLTDELEDPSVESSHWSIAIAIGAGISHHSLPINHATANLMVNRLSNDNTDVRRGAAFVLFRNSIDLSESVLNGITDCAQVEEDGPTCDRLFWALRSANSSVVRVAFQAFEESFMVRRAHWGGLLVQLLMEYPTEFWSAYRDLQSEEIDRVMPSLLAQTAIAGAEITKSISASLQSDCELERSNALIAIRGSGAGVAAATPALLKLYLRGTEFERGEAFQALARIGSAGQFFASEFRDVDSESELMDLQRVQRLMGVREDGVRHIEFLRIGDMKLIREFCMFADCLAQHGPIGLRAVSRILKSQLGENEKKRVSWSPQEISRTFSDFEKALNSVANVPNDEPLIKTSRGKPSLLTETGRLWLRRGNEYLRIVDSE